jgi:hypothetical protein
MKGIGIKSVGIISLKKLIFVILVAGLLLAGTVVPVFAGTSVSFDRFLPLTEQWHFDHPYNLATAINASRSFPLTGCSWRNMLSRIALLNRRMLL